MNPTEREYLLSVTDPEAVTKLALAVSALAVRHGRKHIALMLIDIVMDLRTGEGDWGGIPWDHPGAQTDMEITV